MSHSRRLARNVEQFRAKSSPEATEKRVKPGTPYRRSTVIKTGDDTFEARYHATKGIRTERQPASSTSPLFVPKMVVRPAPGQGAARAKARLIEKLNAEAVRTASRPADRVTRQQLRAAQRKAS